MSFDSTTITHLCSKNKRPSKIVENNFYKKICNRQKNYGIILQTDSTPSVSRRRSRIKLFGVPKGKALDCLDPKNPAEDCRVAFAMPVSRKPCQEEVLMDGYSLLRRGVPKVVSVVIVPEISQPEVFGRAD